MAAANSQGARERNCTLLIMDRGTTNFPSQDELMKQMESSDPHDKVQAIKTAILMIMSGERLPRLLMSVIRFCINTRDKTLKKLLMVFWEIVEKYKPEGGLRDEMILVCNAILNDLKHPNEFIRGCTLRFLCKLNEPEILEPLVPAIKGNLEDRTPFVRRNAVLCLYSVYKNFPDLAPDAPADVDAFLRAESDMASRRNAFIMLFQCDMDRAIQYLVENEEQTQKYGDGFQLVILELVRKVCKTDPTKKAMFSMVVYNMLSSQSPAVVYEAAWTLTSLTGAQAAVRAATTAYCQLLVGSMSDNNIKLIVLDRIAALREAHGKVLRDFSMDLLRALSSPNQHIRRKVLDIAMSMLSQKNIEEVVLVFKKELLKTQDQNVDRSGSYRQLLVGALNTCAERFPTVTVTIVPVLLEFLGDKGALDVVLFVRRIIRSNPVLQAEVLRKLMDALQMIKSSEVFRVVLWIFAEYSNTPELVSQSFEAIKVSLGPLPIVPPMTDNEAATKAAAEAAAAAVPKSRVTVLDDGTYATQTVYSEATSVQEQEEDALPLRKLIVGGDFFLASVVAASLTKLVVKAAEGSGWASGSVKQMQVEAILIMCSIVKLGQTRLESKSRIDMDALERVTLWLRTLVDPSGGHCVRHSLLHACSSSFDTMVAARQLGPSDSKSGEESKDESVVGQPDTLINFRQLRNQRFLGAKEVELDDEADMSRATGMTDSRTDFRERLKHVYQLTGFADPVYAEALVNIHDYDIVLEITVLNRTNKTLTNLAVEVATMGDLKIMDRPQNHTLGPFESQVVKVNIKVSSTDTGQIFGNIVYDSTTSADHVVLNLHDIKIDIMDYIHPATCDEATFRVMWAEFEWENKVTINTQIDDLHTYLDHIIGITNTSCLTPSQALVGECNYIAANLYAKSSFGEDALVNVSAEREMPLPNAPKGTLPRIVGSIRIRSKTQGIALSLGDRIGMLQRKLPVATSDQDTKQ